MCVMEISLMPDRFVDTRRKISIIWWRRVTSMYLRACFRCGMAVTLWSTWTTCCLDRVLQGTVRFLVVLRFSCQMVVEVWRICTRRLFKRTPSTGLTAVGIYYGIGTWRFRATNILCAPSKWKRSQPPPDNRLHEGQFTYNRLCEDDSYQRSSTQLNAFQTAYPKAKYHSAFFMCWWTRVAVAVFCPQLQNGMVSAFISGCGTFSHRRT